MHGFPLAVEEIGEIQTEHVHNPNSGCGGDHGCERLLMRILAVSGNEYELADASRFPRIDQVVQHSVEGLLSERSVTGETSLGIYVHSILHRRSPQHAIFR